ncbi:hypothetical protein [Chakrabartyella piscis]|uniref:hypothetical protein n=1 Tax=Chakrabartyella piscis TaxID=2918914 RepID=UPI0029584C86|nr:hypothetical protein [Chakrabartyella piscis]
MKFQIVEELYEVEGFIGYQGCLVSVIDIPQMDDEQWETLAKEYAAKLFLEV